MRKFIIPADTVKELVTKVNLFNDRIQESNHEFCDKMKDIGIECEVKNGKLVPSFNTEEEKNLYEKLRNEQLSSIYKQFDIEIQ